MYQAMRQVLVTEETEETDAGAAQTALVPWLRLRYPTGRMCWRCLSPQVRWMWRKPLDLFNLRKIPLDGMGKVFWDMHDLTFHIEEGELQVILKSAPARSGSGIWHGRRPKGAAGRTDAAGIPAAVSLRLRAIPHSWT
jgi:hypothetical protein